MENLRAADYPDHEIHPPRRVVEALRTYPLVGLDAVDARRRQARSAALDQLPLMPQPHPVQEGATVTFGLET